MTEFQYHILREMAGLDPAGTHGIIAGAGLWTALSNLCGSGHVEKGMTMDCVSYKLTDLGRNAAREPYNAAD